MSEPISRACPQCDTELSVPRERLGKRARCPDCGHVFTPRGSPPPLRDESPPASKEQTQKPTAERVGSGVADAVFAIWLVIVAMVGLTTFLDGSAGGNLLNAAVGILVLQSILAVVYLRQLRDP